jgi:hypothetical protein
MSIPSKVTQLPAANTIEDVLIRGDLSKLSEQQRTEYYMRLCSSIGLNPLTKPFQYIVLNGKLVLYAGRDCADQLRRINGISIEIVSQDKADGLLSVHVRAKDKDGRQDEDLGVVAYGEHLKGEAAANTILTCVTKAKRRVTLSLSGLGFLDETEVADIPAAAKQVVVETGEMIMPDQVEALEKMIKEIGGDKAELLKKNTLNYFKVACLEDLATSEFNTVVAKLERKRVPV